MKQKAAFQLEKHGTRVVYRLTWGEVRRILGRDHANTAADDAKLARALRAAGARPLGKSYAKEDGWHAFAPKGTPMPALAKRSNPAEGAKANASGAAELMRPADRIEQGVSVEAQDFASAIQRRIHAAGKKHRPKLSSLRDYEWGNGLARQVEADAKSAMAQADAGRKFKGPHDATYFLGLYEGALIVGDALGKQAYELREGEAASREAGEKAPGLLSRIAERARAYVSKRKRAAKGSRKATQRDPKARKRAKPSR